MARGSSQILFHLPAGFQFYDSGIARCEDCIICLYVFYCQSLYPAKALEGCSRIALTPPPPPQDRCTPLGALLTPTQLNTHNLHISTTSGKLNTQSFHTNTATGQLSTHSCHTKTAGQLNTQSFTDTNTTSGQLNTQSFHINTTAGHSKFSHQHHNRTTEHS